MFLLYSTHGICCLTMQWKIGLHRKHNVCHVGPDLRMHLTSYLLLHPHFSLKIKQLLVPKEHFIEHQPSCCALALCACSHQKKRCSCIFWLIWSIWFISGTANYDVSADSSLVQLLLIPATLQKQSIKVGDHPTETWRRDLEPTWQVTHTQLFGTI